MKYLPLVWAGVWRRPGRTTLTLVSIVAAFTIFGVLHAFSAALHEVVANARADLLLTQSRVSDVDRLPVAMADDIRRVPGVKGVARMDLFNGPFRQPTEVLPSLAIDPDELRVVATNLKVPPAQWQALKTRRSGALVSSEIAKLYSLRVGDRLSLHPVLWPSREGANSWTVDVVGIYQQDDNDELFGRDVLLNYDYVDQGVAVGGLTNMFAISVDNALNADRVAAAIDHMTVNSPHATRTFTERQLAGASVAQIGQVGLAVQSITAAIFFALLLSVGAVMIQAGRERTSEFAILKVLGFTDADIALLIFSESLVFCLSAATLGLMLAAALFPLVVRTIHFNLAPPDSAMKTEFGLIVALLLAILTGLVPALRVARTSIVDALAGRLGGAL